jgi:general secretion pathway protein L
MAVDRAWAGPTTVLVPSEDVLILTVDLPFQTRRQREQALGFAIEDELAEPLSALHVALGQEVSPRRHIAGAVRHHRMAHWLTLLAEADVDQAILLPDALTLPTPPAGAWSVRTDEGRALVRTDAGSGFALPARDLTTAWQAAGQPRLRVLGGDLPETLLEGVEDDAVLLGSVAEPVLMVPPLDLRQGGYALARNRDLEPMKMAAAILGVGVAIHLLLLGIDTALLHRMAEAREAETRALLQAAVPTLQPGEDLIAAADRAIPQGGSGVRPFTRLMAQTSGAWPTGQAQMIRIDYDDPGAMTLGVTVPDDAALQAAVAALRAGGLEAAGEPVAGLNQTQTGGINADIRLGAAR